MRTNILFTCKGRPELTEICLRRLGEIPLPEGTTLIIAYDGADDDYLDSLKEWCESTNLEWFNIIPNPTHTNRFALINKALEDVKAEYFIHLENDFFWASPTALKDATDALWNMPDIDYIRFEVLPFTKNDFTRYSRSGEHDICWRRKHGPYRFTLNPHIRKFKFPGGKPFFEGPYEKQPEQYFNDSYTGQAACMTGDNFRHLGIFDEGGHFKPNYGERFFNRRGCYSTNLRDYIEEFDQITSNQRFRDLFRGYVARHMENE